MHICLVHFDEAERFEGGNVHNFLSTSRWYQCVSVRHLFITYHRTHPILPQICSYVLAPGDPSHNPWLPPSRK